MSSLQIGFRSESVRHPRDRFLARSSGGSRSSASVPPISRARTLGSRAAAERVDRELGGCCVDGETLRSLREIFVVLAVDSRVPAALPSSVSAIPASVRPPQSLALFGPCHPSSSSTATEPCLLGPCLPDCVPHAHQAPATSFIVRARLADVPSVVSLFYFSPLGCWSMRCYLLRYNISVNQPLRSDQDINQNPSDCTYQVVCKVQGSIRSEDAQWYGQNPSILRFED